ncbi:hypothetical protein K440DRAFT_668873 [Wilcoxina mikolae CBS 423.85]|nr:hypothetical protein K440DRAFT_668873 [Wilcoxina mikolae CBS 423.85]
MTTRNNTPACIGGEDQSLDTIPVEKTIPFSWFLNWSQQRSSEINVLRQQLLSTNAQLVKALVNQDTYNPEWEEEHKHLTLRFKELERDNAKLKEEIESVLEANRRLLGNAGSGNQLVDELDKENITLRAHIQELETQQHHQHEELQCLVSELRDVEGEKTALGGEYKNLCDAFQELQKEKLSLLEEIHGLKVAIERLQNDNEGLKKSKLYEEEQKKQLLEVKVAWEHEKVKLGRDMKRLFEDNQQLEKEKNGLQEEKHLWEKLGLEAEVNHLRSENNELKQIKELQDEKEAKLQQRGSGIEKEVLCEKARLGDEKKHLEEMKRNLDDGRQNLEVKMNELLDEQSRLMKWEKELDEERLQVWKREAALERERACLQEDREGYKCWAEGSSEPGNKIPSKSQENVIEKPSVPQHLAQAAAQNTDAQNTAASNTAAPNTAVPNTAVPNTAAPNNTSPLEQLNTNGITKPTSSPGSTTVRIPPHIRAASKSPPLQENTSVSQKKPANNAAPKPANIAASKSAIITTSKPAPKLPKIAMFHGAPHERDPKFIASWILSIEEHAGVNATDNHQIQLARIHLDSLRAYPWFAGYCMKTHGIRDMRKTDIYPFSWKKFVKDFKEKWELVEEN